MLRLWSLTFLCLLQAVYGGVTSEGQIPAGYSLQFANRLARFHRQQTAEEPSLSTPGSEEPAEEPSLSTPGSEEPAEERIHGYSYSRHTVSSASGHNTLQRGLHGTPPQGEPKQSSSSRFTEQYEDDTEPEPRPRIVVDKKTSSKAGRNDAVVREERRHKSGLRTDTTRTSSVQSGSNSSTNLSPVDLLESDLNASVHKLHGRNDAVVRLEQLHKGVWRLGTDTTRTSSVQSGFGESGTEAVVEGSSTPPQGEPKLPRSRRTGMTTSKSGHIVLVGEDGKAKPY